MPKNKPRIDYARPEIPKVPDVREPEPLRPEPVEVTTPEADRPSGIFDRIKLIVLSTVIPFIRENVRVKLLSVDYKTRTAVVIVSVLGKEILRKAVKF